MTAQLDVGIITVDGRPVCARCSRDIRRHDVSPTRLRRGAVVHLPRCIGVRRRGALDVDELLVE